MALLITNTKTDVKGSQRSFSGEFQFTAGDDEGDIITSLDQVQFASATYGLDGFTLPLSLKSSASLAPNLPSATLTLTGDADSRGFFEVKGL